MNEPLPQALNERFAIADQLHFQTGPGGFPIAEIRNAYAASTVCLYGGHVMSYQPADQEEVLWVSRQAIYESGKAIRGGIPVCWPWFADHPEDPSKPAHGLVRNRMWEVLDTAVVDGDQTRLRLGISDSQQTREVWPYPFRLTVAVTIGPKLKVDLAGVNSGNETMICGGALHSYFSVAAIGQTAIHGLEEIVYIDKVDAFKRKRQKGLVNIEGPTDSVYLDTTDDCVIEDVRKGRRIRVAKSGSRSTVIWNPWSDKAVGMSDFGNEEYHGMVCVETANAADDVMTVGPDQVHRMGTQISVERIATNP